MAADTLPVASAEDQERFWSLVAKGGEDDCWPFEGKTNRDGYGVLTWRGRWVLAHRVAYGLATGAVLDSLTIIRHGPHCLRRCCNPAHLVAGTHADNVADRVRDGHTARGERHGRSKLTWQQVDTIRQSCPEGVCNKAAIGRRFGVSRRAIQFIVRGLHYREGDRHSPYAHK
jgi:hypothetical protein